MQKKRFVANNVWRVGILVLPALLSAGCGVDFNYLVPAITGQLDLLQQTIPVEQALASGTLTDEQVAKLKLIQRVRIYARDAIGLEIADHYTTYYDSGGEPVAYNISACRKDGFVPRTWTFPIVGTVPYLGYFSRPAVELKREELKAEDLDVFIYPVDAYSGLGFYPNPILSPMLNRRESNLVDTVIHELLHNTVWRTDDTAFNESLATFVGRTGAIGFLAEEHPEDQSWRQEAAESFEDIDRYNVFALGLFEELDAFYASDLSSETKTLDRVGIFEAARERFVTDVWPLMNNPEGYSWVANGLPVNNAWVLGIRRYNLNLAVFEQVFEATGQDWQAALLLFRQAASAPEPYAFLSDWLGALASQPPLS